MQNCTPHEVQPVGRTAAWWVCATCVTFWALVGVEALRATPTPTATRTPTPSNTPTPTPRPDLLVVTAIVPSSGPASGGTAVTITGANFAVGANATIGGVVASGVEVVDAEHISAFVPLLSPATLDDVTVTNLNLDTATLRKGWLADFLDVPQSSLFHAVVEKVFRAGATAGCGDGLYCPGALVTRAQSAVFLLKASTEVPYGGPPPCVGVFADVPCPGPFADWIEFFRYMGYTVGCDANDYCPNVPATRAQMAILLLKVRHGGDYIPPPCHGVFGDVPCPGLFADWIEQLAAEGITAGCGGANFCPANPVNRGQMAVFLAKSFYLAPLN